ncbi:thioredoxin H9-like isoform X2 [Silene latifolia]|uniref:thioredoxin H9-like isoform X2 n=1 Tax=Silene latifolia TaxID=37657 RepID=UPI003D76D4E9
MGQCWTRFCKRPYKRRHVIGGKVCHINKLESWEEKLTEAKQDGKIAVVKFSASWCKPCKEIATPYRELADKYSSLVFLAVDVDEMAELSSSWEIKATPTFYFIRSGQPMDKLVGANKSELQKKIATIVDLASKM